MNTIEAYEKDILLQTQALKNFIPQKMIPPYRQKSTFFCGSGDSLAAAMLAEAFSDFRVKAIDPLDLLKNPQLFENKTFYLVSISGKTISNIKAAKKSKKSVAITYNPQSKLAKASTQSIVLRFPNSDVFTAGSISFLESALTCISLVANFRVPEGYEIFDKAVAEAKNSTFGDRVFVIGNMHTFPVAMYATAKFFELLGSDAHFERIEQFSHMELFSVKKGDTVIIFEPENSHNRQLRKNLQRNGIKVLQPAFNSRNKISQFIFYTFYSQLLPLLKAKKLNKKECYFVTAKNLRKVSDNMIY